MAKNILIIEDDEFLRSLINTKLTAEGFTVDAAPDGETGIKKIKKDKPDLVLLDLLLPGIDGFEVLTKAREDEATKSIPIIILSNLDQKGEIDRGIKLGATDFLIKSQITSAEIIEKIKKTL